MSFAQTCCSVCNSPISTAIPGPEGDPGSDGANGINAFTLLTAPFTIPAPAGQDTAFVADSTWMAVGQVLILSDGTDLGHFQVASAPPTSTSVVLEFLDYPEDSATGLAIGTGGTVSPSGVLASIDDPLLIANGGTSAANVQDAITNLGLKKTPLTVYAAGTAYQLTNTAALLDFGTTDPSLTIDAEGVYLILATARIDFNGATFAANQTVTLKLRRTNNTAADIANSTTQAITDIITTEDYTMGIFRLPPVIYTTTNTDDILQLWGDVSVVPSAGSIDAVEASIVAVRLFDQTL